MESISKQDRIAKKEQIIIAKEKLQLTAEQELKLKEINQNFVKQASETKESGISKIDKIKKLRSLKAEKDASIEILLSPKQFEDYLLMQDENKERRKQNRAKR
jgi:hypothetical protein